MKIYISGKISGTTDYKKRFCSAEREIRKAMGGGVSIVNPGMMQEFTDWEWSDYMRRDIQNLMDCDAIYMLRGWRRSSGARIEHYIAKRLGLAIVYQNKRGIVSWK
ncbi:MAG: DUF4406 domain-containing protein [Treponema sp.]|nr:DUF4406 domain-containing protein [Candidatus Treponema scatequi]